MKRLTRRNLEEGVDDLTADEPSTFEQLFMADLKRVHGYEIDQSDERALEDGELQRAMQREVRVNSRRSA